MRYLDLARAVRERSYRDRHGNVRIYYRVTGRPKVRLQGVPWTPDFMAQYDAAKGVATPKVKGVTSGTWRWLCVKYFAECAEYKRLDARTQHVRRQIGSCPLWA